MESFDFNGQYWIYEAGIGVSISSDGKVVAMGDTTNEYVKTMDIRHTFDNYKYSLCK